VGVHLLPDGGAHLVAQGATVTDEQATCLACGEPVGRNGRICDECLWDTVEVDHDDREVVEARND
jgi:predicted amidophosphoribosyltransferase